MSSNESREIFPFRKYTPAMDTINKSMPEGEGKPVYPFIKVPPGDSESDPEDSMDNLVEDDTELLDPKDESAVASVVSPEHQTLIEQVESGMSVPQEDSLKKAIGLDAEMDNLISKESERSMPSSSLPKSPGLKMPPVPVTPPTSD